MKVHVYVILWHGEHVYRKARNTRDTYERGTPEKVQGTTFFNAPVNIDYLRATQTGICNYISSLLRRKILDILQSSCRDQNVIKSMHNQLIDLRDYLCTSEAKLFRDMSSDEKSFTCSKYFRLEKYRKDGRKIPNKLLSVNKEKDRIVDGSSLNKILYCNSQDQVVETILSSNDTMANIRNASIESRGGLATLWQLIQSNRKNQRGFFYSIRPQKKIWMSLQLLINLAKTYKYQEGDKVLIVDLSCNNISGDGTSPDMEEFRQDISDEARAAKRDRSGTVSNSDPNWKEKKSQMQMESQQEIDGQNVPVVATPVSSSSDTSDPPPDTHDPPLIWTSGPRKRKGPRDRSNTKKSRKGMGGVIYLKKTKKKKKKKKKIHRNKTQKK
jgi:hypothetical protein